MSSYKRIPDSVRNQVIEQYRKGEENPEYEVIPNKSIEGKYTVRRRKVTLPADKSVEEPVDNAGSEEKQDPPEPELPDEEDLDYFPQWKLNKNAMFREMQMQMNRMLIEQMKLMRQSIKHQKTKHDKMKGRTQRVYNLLAEIANQDDEEPEPTPQSAPPPQKQEEGAPDYFNNEYLNKEPVKEVVPEQPLPVPEPKEYAQPYEEDIDALDGQYFVTTSRRNRLKSFI